MFLSCAVSKVLSLIYENLNGLRDPEHTPLMDRLSCIGYSSRLDQSHLKYVLSPFSAIELEPKNLSRDIMPSFGIFIIHWPVYTYYAKPVH